MLAALNILPDAYYDLTPPETEALLKGVSDRELSSLRQTRKIATLLRNAHFSDPVTEQEYMPLPGDDEAPVLRGHTDPEVAFMLLGSAMGGELTIEYHGYESVPNS